MNLPDFLTRHRYGEIRLTGHRIDLFHVVERYKEGSSAERIVEEFPTLSLLQVERVLAFYRENREEVDRYVAECRAEIDRQASAPQPGPSFAELRRRMEERKRSEAK
jgi:uncharacterized protein (DUF433 family)